MSLVAAPFSPGAGWLPPQLVILDDDYNLEINNLVVTNQAMFNSQKLNRHQILEQPLIPANLLKPKIAIVVDDLGDNPNIAKLLSELPTQLTLAILPHTPYAQAISDSASLRGHEIIMHLPMEAMSRPDLLGPGALMASMNQAELIKTFIDSANSVPNLVGFNNHMGSLLTQDKQKMSWLMNAARQQNWYFLDSRTATTTIAQQTASQSGVLNIARDVFLDHHQPNQTLLQVLSFQLKRLKAIARKKGQAVAICHPYSQTYHFLRDNIAALEAEFELVHLSELLVRNKTDNMVADNSPVDFNAVENLTR